MVAYHVQVIVGRNRTYQVEMRATTRHTEFPVQIFRDNTSKTSCEPGATFIEVHVLVVGGYK